jgi:hypothetical protein
MADFRALCAEILQTLDQYEDGQRVDWDAWRETARSALAQPEPVAHQDKLDRLIAMDRDDPPNDLSHLSDEEFNALAPQGYHATGPAEPLSPAAQAVKDAVLALYSDEKVHKFGWQLDAPTVAAALRAAADQRIELEVPFLVVDEWEKVKGFCARFYAAAEWGRAQALQELLAIADELDDTPKQS